jgi:hypothetical protein
VPVEEYKPSDVIFRASYLSTFQTEVLKFIEVIPSYKLHPFSCQHFSFSQEISRIKETAGSLSFSQISPIFSFLG